MLTGTLTGTVKTLAGTVATNSANIDALRGTVKTMGANVATNTADIEALKQFWDSYFSTPIKNHQVHFKMNRTGKTIPELLEEDVDGIPAR